MELKRGKQPRDQHRHRYCCRCLDERHHEGSILPPYRTYQPTLPFNRSTSANFLFQPQEVRPPPPFSYSFPTSLPPQPHEMNPYWNTTWQQPSRNWILGFLHMPPLLLHELLLSHLQQQTNVQLSPTDMLLISIQLLRIASPRHNQILMYKLSSRIGQHQVNMHWQQIVAMKRH